MIAVRDREDRPDQLFAVADRGRAPAPRGMIRSVGVPGCDTRRAGTRDSPGRDARLAVGLPGDDEVLRALLAGGERPASRADGHRIALVVSGGGMRGAYAGGMVHALADAGLGALLRRGLRQLRGGLHRRRAAAGQRPRVGGTSSSRTWRAGSSSTRAGCPRRPLVSLDHLLDDVLVRSKPLDWDRLRDSPVPLRVVATALDDLSAARPRTDHVAGVEARAAGHRVDPAARRARPSSCTGDAGSTARSAEPLPVLRALATARRTYSRCSPDRPRSCVAAIPVPGRPAGRAPWTGSRPASGRWRRRASRHAPVLAVLDDAAHPSRDGAHLLALAPGARRRASAVSPSTSAARRARAASATSADGCAAPGRAASARALQAGSGA